jgi:hypothetical protein
VKGKKINQNTLACLKVGRLHVEEKKGEREIWRTERISGLLAEDLNLRYHISTVPVKEYFGLRQKFSEMIEGKEIGRGKLERHNFSMMTRLCSFVMARRSPIFCWSICLHGRTLG